MDIRNVIKTLLQDGLILVFNKDELDVVKTAEALKQAGLNNMEVTCRIKKPLEKLKQIRKELPDFVVGSASLIDSDNMLRVYNKAHPDDPLPDVQQAVDAGAQFIVSAGNFRSRTFEKYAKKVTMIPGCGTVSEIIIQFAMGANFCKVFPAKQLGGPAFIKAIDPAIHKIISLIPTGGTNADNISQYIAIGVLVLGGSFSMIEKDVMARIIEQQDYNLLAEELKTIKQLIDKQREKQWPDVDFDAASLEQITKVTGREFNL